MNQADYNDLKEALSAMADGVALHKRREYTGANEDVLTNFKRIGKRLGLSTLQVWSVYFNKHVDSVNTFSKGKGPLSESMDSRFADLLNYLYLGYAIIKEEGLEEK